MKIVSFSLEEGNKYYGSIDGERFYIGARVPYLGNKGLMNTVGKTEQRYDRAAFRARFGFWADFIHPTAMAEGGLYHTLNTYDRAGFTFSFLQFAAHVPNGDVVLYFRALLQQPLAAEYFPDLALRQGRICKIGGDGPTALESDSSTDALMRYLNPTSLQVEDTELIQAAKFIHWVQHDERHRLTQITIGVANFKTKMGAYAKQYQLDNASAAICVVVADIRHQGRAKSPEIVSALRSGEPLQALLAIGDSQYRERLAVLRGEIDALTEDGSFGRHRYSLAKGDFIAA